MDILSFKSKVPDEVCTKRSILSAVAQCYDPIGLLAPFILYLKLLVKKLWQLQLDRDAVPPIDICNVWENLRSEWHEIDNFQLCRHIGVKRNCPVMLLGFSDASKDGYGAVIYASTFDAIGLNFVQPKAAQCYDPIGLLAPFILYLNLLVKKLWQLQLDWDAVPLHWENLRI
nr:unnamed protein product [Callosobruchus analis]